MSPPFLRADVARVGFDVAAVAAGEEAGDGVDACGVGAEAGRARQVVIAPGLAQDDEEDLQGDALLLFIREQFEGCDRGHVQVGRGR